MSIRSLLPVILLLLPLLAGCAWSNSVQGNSDPHNFEIVPESQWAWLEKNGRKLKPDPKDMGLAFVPTFIFDGQSYRTPKQRYLDLCQKIKRIQPMIGRVRVPIDGKPQVIVSYAAVELADHRILICSGSVEGGSADSQQLARSWLYDLKTNVTIEGPPMRHARYGCALTVLSDGRVLITGGTDGGERTLASCEIYDPLKNQFEDAGAIHFARTHHSAVRLPNDNVLIVNGIADARLNSAYVDSAELFDPRRKQSVVVGKSNFYCLSPMIFVDQRGKVVVAGGYHFENDNLLFNPTVEMYTGPIVCPSTQR